MIKVYYTYTSILKGIRQDSLKEIMAPVVLSRLERLKRDSDRSLLLASSYLLSKVLLENHCGLIIGQIQYDMAGRPFFPGSSFDFNISHTGDCVAIVYSEGCRAGIDVEIIKDVDLSEFEFVFPQNVMNTIKSSVDQIRSFYHYWTLLESALKAHGDGLPLMSSHIVEISENYLSIENKKWFYRHLGFNPAISCCVASDKAINNIVCMEIKLF